MTDLIATPHDAILRHARNENERHRKDRTPLTMPCIVATCCALGIALACCAEFYSAGVGFRAAFPMKSDGTSLASDLASLRYPIIFCLLAGDVVLHGIPTRMGSVLNRILDTIGLGAIFLLLFGVGAFMFSATFLTLGGESGQGMAGNLVGLALGVASAAMFSLSFLASHSLLGKLFAAVPVIAAGRAERARIAVADALIADADKQHTHVATLREGLADFDEHDVLERKAAVEAGVIVGNVYAEFRDLCDSRKVRGDAELEAEDHSDVPDVPLAALEQRCHDLERYTFDYFFNVLKRKEA